MPIRIITLEREYGSGGGEIAERVAARMGWKLWDQLLTEEIARRLDCDCRAVEDHEEKRDPAYYRLFKAAVEAARASAAGAEQAVTQARARLAQSQAQLQYAETKPQQISVQRSRAQAAEAESEKAAADLQQGEGLHGWKPSGEKPGLSFLGAFHVIKSAIRGTGSHCVKLPLDVERFSGCRCCICACRKDLLHWRPHVTHVFSPRPYDG